MEVKRIPLVFLSSKQSSVLKGLAILLVMLGHTDYLYKSGAWGVDLFLILSAYGLCSSSDSKGLAQFWTKRIRGVYLPYLIVILFQIIALRADYLGQFVCSVLGLDFYRNIDKTMWYISFLFFWYLAFYIVSNLCGILRNKMSKTKLGLLRCGLLFICGYVCVLLTRTSLWHIAAGACLYTFAFPIGSLLYELKNVLLNGKLRKAIWLVVLIFCAIIIFKYYGVEFSSMNIYSVFAMAWALFLFALVQIVPFGKFFSTTLGFLGKYAYAIYLFEGFFIFSAGPWFASIGSQYLRDAVKIICSIGCGVLFWRFLLPAVNVALDSIGKQIKEISKKREKSS